MVWYSHLFKNFPQFVVIHTVRIFRVVSEAEIDIFLEFPCVLQDPANDPWIILSNKRCVYKSGWPSSSSLQAIDAGEDVEKRSPPTLLVAMQLDTTAMENAARFLKRDPTPECVSGENRNMKTFMPPSVHSSTVYNNPDMEATSVSSVCVCACVRAQLCPTVCNPTDYSPPDSSVHGIFQARIMEQVAISFVKMPRGRDKDVVFKYIYIYTHTHTMEYFSAI